MDALANNPERFSQAEIADTGETRLHLLAKAGKVEIFESLLKDDRIHKELVRGLLFPDKLNWHPVMSATKADSGAKEMIESLIGFLDTHIKSEQEVQDLIGNETPSRGILCNFFLFVNFVLFVLLYIFQFSPFFSTFSI